MSAVPSPVPTSIPAADQSQTIDMSQSSRKSYRRKYRKIMVKFEDRMRESNGLFRDEQRIFDISQRLAEQTDQILEMLLELNSNPQVPRQLRYNLKPNSRKVEQPFLGGNNDIEHTHEEIRLGRSRVQKGEMTPFDFEMAQRELLEVDTFAPTKHYASHSRNAGFFHPTQNQYQNFDSNSTPTHAALTVSQEEMYLQNLDAFLSGKSTISRAHAYNSLGSRSAEKTVDRERETQLKNPVSVYNWLRRHQPQVFLQDHESSADKTSKSSGSRISKRAPGGREARQEQELYDDDGIALEYGSSSRGKRKRDEDGPFRPKGGKSHSTKRRKEEASGAGPGKKAKRSPIDARNT